MKDGELKKRIWKKNMPWYEYDEDEVMNVIDEAKKEFPDAVKYCLIEPELEARKQYEKAIEVWFEKWFGE